METKKENSKNLPKNDDGTDLRRLPLLPVAVDFSPCFLTSLVSSTSLRALTPASNLATAFYRLIVRTSYDSDPTALFYHQPLPPTINLFSTIRTLVRSWLKSWCRNGGKLWTINVFLSLSKWRMWMKQAVELKTRITKIWMEIETCQS